MVKCIVPGCKSNNKEKDFDKNIRFVSFPKNEDLVRQWKIACNIENRSNVGYLRVCSLHFKKYDWSLKDRLLKNVSKWPKLKEDVVPSLRLPKHAIETERTKRMERKLIVEESPDKYKRTRTKCTHHDENLIPEEVNSTSEQLVSINIDQLENFKEDKSVQTEIDIECAREFHIMKLEKVIRCLQRKLDTFSTDFTILNKKCGAIFAKTDEIFFIVCTYCNIPFTEFTQFTEHYANNHSDKCNNVSDGEYEQIDSIEIKPYDGFSDSNSNGSVSEINQCNDNEANIIDSNTNDDLLLLNESNEINKSVITEDKEKSTEILKENKNIETSLVFSCDLCGGEFSSEKNVKRHKKFDHRPLNPFEDSVNVINVEIDPRQINPDPRQLNSLEDSVDVSNDGTDPRQCRFCGHVYSRKSQRIIHERKHTGETPFKCGFCDKRFSCIAHCKRHEKLHKGIKPFKCVVCDKSFAQKSNLTTHLRRHAGEKFHSCDYCDKTFCDVAEKKIHERVHTGEKPYQCYICGRCFIVQSSLNNHIRNTHKTVRDYLRPYECNDCTENFSTRNELRKHEATHSDLRPFQCEICGKAFKLSNELKLHEIIHYSEPKYACQICEKKFKYKSDCDISIIEW